MQSLNTSYLKSAQIQPSHSVLAGQAFVLITDSLSALSHLGSMLDFDHRITLILMCATYLGASNLPLTHLITAGFAKGGPSIL